MDKLKDFIVEFGGIKVLADALGVTPSMIYQWLAERRPVSPRRAAQIQHLSGGRVLASDLDRTVDWESLHG
ncbi:MAG: putative antitoxin of bacterial toxin-antitoxin system, YdaS/YdaT [Pseudomonadota bacterium]|jgi:DNA-binding transcriptional regulator YdaS (Cro superfamily)